MTTNPTPHALTICSSGQVARLLGIPDRTVCRYLASGRLPATQNPITGRWSITHEAVMRFLREHGMNLSMEAAP